MGPSSSPRPTRRRLLASSVAVFGSIAGCSSLTERTATTTDPGQTTDAGVSGTTAETSASELLSINASGALYPVVREAAAVWNLNPSPADDWYWAPSRYDLDTDRRLADHFAGERGFEPTGERSRPPFSIAVGSGPPTAVAEDVASGAVDLGGTPSHVAAVLPHYEDTEGYVEHAVARTGSVFVVSDDLVDEGVTALTPAEVRDVYAGEVTNWRAVGGPDRAIHVVTSAEGEPPRRIVTDFFEDTSLTGIDHRAGQIPRRLRRVDERDDAIADVRVGGHVGKGAQPLDVIVDGKRVGYRDAAYPTVHDARLYVWQETDDHERAFLDMIRSSFGQQTFVVDQRGLVELGQ